jgi:L-malate glycosyltransferase
MQKIRVLHIIKSLGRGGAEMLLPETLRLHDTSKFEFHYIYFLPWKDQMVGALDEQGAKVTCLDAKNNLELLLKAGKINKYCKDHNINLIHSHLPWAGFIGRIVHSMTGIPMVYTEHNMQERYHFITKVLNTFSFNFQSLALGVSEEVSKSIKNNIYPRVRVETLLNGVNTKKYTREKTDRLIRVQYNIPEDAVVFTNVAVFRFQKRLVEWLQVFKNIANKNSNVYGIIVGAGPLESEIKTEVRRLELESKVFFPGIQTDVKPYFNATDIFMMSSSFEGLPIALLEAMSMECAVITTDAGGIKEVIRDEVDGLVCDVENWNNLESMAQYLIDYPLKLKEYKKASRVRVQKNFSLEKMVEELEAKYYELISLKNK